MGFIYSKFQSNIPSFPKKIDKLTDMIEKFEERISKIEEKINENSDSLTKIHQKIKFLEDLTLSNEKKTDQILDSRSWKMMNFFNEFEKFVIFKKYAILFKSFLIFR
jgi:uncharacterized coiled-coil DUF342 family protein